MAKSKRTYQRQIDGMYLSFYQSGDIKINSESFRGASRQQIIALQEAGIDDSALQEFFEEMNGYQLTWHAKKAAKQDRERYGGSIRLLSVDDLLGPGEGLIFQPDAAADDPARDFRIVDFFVDEACVGLFAGREDRPGLHYFEFENRFYPLELDFAGYFELMIQARAFWYWPRVLVEHAAGAPGPVSAHFRETLPRIFEEFDPASFLGRYDELRRQEND